MFKRRNVSYFLLGSITLLVVCFVLPRLIDPDVSDRVLDDDLSHTQPMIAFMSARDGNPEIYVMDVDGHNQRNLTNHPSWDSRPSWSPDNRYIAFESDRSGNFDIWIMDVNGGSLNNLTNSPNDETAPAWSPDGKLIAYEFVSPENEHEIYVMDITGKNRRNLTNSSENFPTGSPNRNPPEDLAPSWSPDSRWIVFESARTGNLELWITEVNGDITQQLTDHFYWDKSPAWSPNGQWIAWYNDRAGNYDQNIWLMNSDGSDQRSLTTETTWEGDPSWSPDSQRIVFTKEDHSCLGGSCKNIFVIDVNGNNMRRLTNVGPWNDFPAWSH